MCVCECVRFFLPCQNILLPGFFVLDNVITIYGSLRISADPSCFLTPIVFLFLKFYWFHIWNTSDRFPFIFLMTPPLFRHHFFLGWSSQAQIVWSGLIGSRPCLCWLLSTSRPGFKLLTILSKAACSLFLNSLCPHSHLHLIHHIDPAPLDRSCISDQGAYARSHAFMCPVPSP